MLISYDNLGYNVTEKDGRVLIPIVAFFYLKDIPDRYLLKEFSLSESTTNKGSDQSLVLKSFKEDNYVKQMLFACLSYHLELLGIDKSSIYQMTTKLSLRTESVDLILKVILHVPKKKEVMLQALLDAFDINISNLIYSYFCTESSYLTVESKCNNENIITTSFRNTKRYEYIIQRDGESEIHVSNEDIPSKIPNGNIFTLDTSGGPSTFDSIPVVKRISPIKKKKSKIIIKDLPVRVKTTKTKRIRKSK